MPNEMNLAPSKTFGLRRSAQAFALASFALLAAQCSSGGDGDEASGGSGGEASAGASGEVDGGKGGVALVGTGGSGGGSSEGGSAGKGAGGSPGSGGMMGGMVGMAVGGAGGVAVGGAGGVASQDKRPTFSFFATSQAGIVSFATDKVNGMGGDLGGLAGADNICMKLAQKGNPGDKKVWHAFLSVHKGPDGQPINAIDRIGKGPWYNFSGKLFAMNLQSLIPDNTQTAGRPKGGDPTLAAMFTDENGDPMRPSMSVDNHDTLTGSEKNGKLKTNVPAGVSTTCNDWTSTSESLPPPMIGHSWPRSSNNGRHWISEHSAGGCGKGIDTEVKASNGTKTVGAGGGFGGFYCFAVTGD